MGVGDFEKCCIICFLLDDEFGYAVYMIHASVDCLRGSSMLDSGVICWMVE